MEKITTTISPELEKSEAVVHLTPEQIEEVGHSLVERGLDFGPNDLSEMDGKTLESMVEGGAGALINALPWVFAVAGLAYLFKKGTVNPLKKTKHRLAA